MKAKMNYALLALVSSLALLAAPLSAQQGPQGPFANVSAAAVCTVVPTGTGFDVKVDALLVQKEKTGPGSYQVGTVTFVLEQKVRNNSKFQEVGGSRVTNAVNQSFDEVAAGQSVEVDTHTYSDVCTSLPVASEANAVRGIVEIQVLNANPARGFIHTGRCLSFPNPCRR